ncbi:pilus assembly protein [Thiohalospira sp.]|uniref:pilus assembly protein n=1 Tax=Thiohalospira sp. TaxID=3080549 RepID=UPI00398044DA
MNRQRGAVLILALTLLMALAALVLASFRGADIQQLLAAGQRDREAALTTAEAALEDAWTEGRGRMTRPTTCSGDGCDDVYPRGELPLGPGNDWRVTDDSWWEGNGTAAGGGHYVVEYLGFVPDDLGVGREGRNGRDLYRVIARATGDRPGTRVILEAVYARRFTD